MFDKQVKTQLISDTFTLIGLRGYNKNDERAARKEKEERCVREGTNPNFESEPIFEESMNIS